MRPPLARAAPGPTFPPMPARPPIRGTVRTDERARAAYAEGAGIYRIVPAMACVPADEADVAALLRWASAEGVALVPRGAGSAMGGGNVGEGVVVDLTQLAPRRLEVDANRRRARTSANVTLRELEGAAAPLGLRMPVDPSSARWVTLGGMLSTNAAGARSVRCGAVRAWVEGCTLVTADGERLALVRGEAPEPAVAAVARFARDVAPAVRAAAAEVATRAPRTRKNTAGYALDAWLASGDLLDLVIGAEGTLGVVTDVTWRLEPSPAARLGLRVELDALDAIAPAVRTLLATGPAALELLDRTFLDVVRSGGAGDVPPGEAVLLLEYEGGSEAEVRAAAEAAAAAVRHHAARVTLSRNAAETAAIWALRHAASPILARLPETRRSLQVVEDGCVPLERLGEYLALLRGAAERRGMPIVLFGHAGDGHVHANLLPDVTAPGWERLAASLLEEVTDGLLALGGTPAGEHGDGRLRAGFVERLYGPTVMGLFRRLKAAFDPAGVLNPGIKLPAPGAPGGVARLKVGAGAEPIPADIEAALRAVERHGGYATPRLLLADGEAPGAGLA